MKTINTDSNPSRLWPFRLAAKAAVLSAALLLAMGSQRASAADPDLIFSVLSSACPASGSWPIDDPVGGSLSRSGSPSTMTINGQNWERNNRMTSQDAWRFARYATPLPVNGVTIVAAVRPVYCVPGGEPRGEIVDIFYDRLALAISHADGRIMVCRNYWNDWGPAIPNGQITILSLVVQPNGSYEVFANGVSVMTGGADGDFSTSINPDHTATWGGDPDFTHYIDVGRNDPDGWSAFNGNIGDVYLYKVAVAAPKRTALESTLMAKFGTAQVYTLTTTATPSTGGTITVSDGNNQMPEHWDKTVTIATNYSYTLTDVKVDGVSAGAISSHTFSDVTANHSIEAIWSGQPTFSGTVIGPSGPVYSAKVALEDSSSVMTNAAGQYMIVAANGSHTLTASKGGFVTSAPLPATMTGSVSVTGLDITLAKSPTLDPLVSLDASTLTPGTNLASWTNTGSLGGTFDKYASGTGPNVVANYAGTGRQAVEFVQLTQDDAGRRTLALQVTSDPTSALIPAPAAITGNSDWTISTDLYRADMGGGDNAYLSWSGSRDGNGGSANFFYKDNYAYGHWGIDYGFASVPSAGSWHNVTITFDGTREKIYVDGVLDRNDAHTLNIGTSHMMIVGSRTDDNSRGNDNYWRFNGAISKLRIFDQALTADEVAALNGIVITTYRWTGSNLAPWSDTANWSSATLPGGSNTAVFSDTSAAGATVELDIDAGVKGLEFNNYVAGTTIASSAGKILSVGSDGIQVDWGSHTISAGISAPNGINMTGPGVLNLRGSVTTSGPAYNVPAIIGTPGEIILGGTGTWTDTSLSYVNVGCLLGTATLAINDSATLDFTGTAGLVIGFNADESGRVVQNGGTVKTLTPSTGWQAAEGPGMQLGQISGATSTAEYDLNGGILMASSIYNIRGFATGVHTLPNGPAVFKFNGGVLQATQNNSTDPNVVGEGCANLMGNLTHAYIGNNGARIDTVAFTCSLDQALEHDPAASATDGGLTKMGVGTLTLLRASTYTGATKVEAGVLSCATVTSLAPAQLEIADLAKVDLNYIGNRTIPSLKLGAVTKGPGVYGAGTDPDYFTGTGTVAVRPYDEWANTYAGGGTPGEDYNHDGVQNGIAYFMGKNGLATNPGVVDGKVTWPHVNGVASFEVQVSGNLRDWTPAEPGDVDTTSSPGNVIYTLPVGAGKKFCRLVVVP